MPLYLYKCVVCGHTDEHYESLDSRDSEHRCSKCQALAELIMAAPTIGKSAHQTQAIMSDGSKVPGHFGKDAERRRKKQ